MSDPKVNSASSVDGVTVDVVFDQAMDQAGDFVEPASYTIPGHTVKSIATPAADVARLTIDPEQFTGATLAVAVSDQLENAIAESMDVGFLSAAFVGAGDHPTVVSAEPVTPTKIRVNFSEPMKRTTLGAVGSYALSPLTPGSAPLYFTSIDVPGLATPDFVEIPCSEMTDGATYRVEVSSAVKDTAGNGIDPGGDSDDFTGLGQAPIVKEVQAVGKNRIDVMFDEPMKDNADIRDPGRYALSGGLSVVAVLDVVDDTVQLVTDDQDPGALYNLTITT